EDAAAVVLLAWEAELKPAEVPVPLVEAPPPLPEPGASSPSLEVRANAGAQLWLSAADPTWGAAGAIEVHGRRFGVALSVSGQGRRDLVLGTGHATWSRFSVALGPAASFHVVDGVDLSAGVSLAVGPFWVTGSGFDKPYSVTDWDLG